jgi:hypothetical protein
LLRTVPDNPFFRSIDSSLGELIQGEPVEVVGAWSTKTRKTYQSEKQIGRGIGPFLEVEDRHWHGTLNCRAAASGILFLLTTTKVFWVKAPTVALTMPVAVSLHAYAEYTASQAMFTAGMGGAALPSMPVATPARLDEVCGRGPMTLMAGRVVTLAQTNSAAFAAIVLPGIVLKMGRNHLWKLRDDFASSLAPDIRELLTRRRSGAFEIGSDRNGSAAESLVR